jgi:Flp pilus assembly protein TadG
MLRRLLRDGSGTFAIEMAIIMPVLVTLLLGSVELGRFVILHQKLDRAATSMGDLASQSSTPCASAANVPGLFPIVPELVTPFWTNAAGVAIVSEVVNTTGAPVIGWQVAGAGTYAGASRIGHAGGAAALPTGFTVASGDTAIVSEVLFNFTPLFLGSAVPARILYHTAFYRPRC